MVGGTHLKGAYRGAGAVAALLLVGLSTSVVSPPRACACSCAPVEISPEETLLSFDAVFVGVPTSVETRGMDDAYEIEVSEVYTGDVGAVVTLTTPSETAACGVSLELGEEDVFAVTASYSEPATFRTATCSRFAVGRFDVRKVAEEVFGAATPPVVTTPTATVAADEVSRSASGAVIAGAAVFTVVAGTAVLILALRRRRT
ncbi:MAG: hypothetical protein ABW137_01650 [Mycobacterium sp.]